jgi:hypothetical protein
MTKRELRHGADRLVETGRYGAKTKVMHVPANLVQGEKNSPN